MLNIFLGRAEPFQKNAGVRMNRPQVVFETKCWEHDWQMICREDHLKRLFERLDYPFSERFLFINNVDDLSRVKHRVDSLVSKGVISGYFVVDDYAAGVLEHFGLSRETLGAGYYYSIAELTAMYLAKAPWLLHMSGDSYLPKKVDGAWIDRAIERMEVDSSLKVANLVWNEAWDGAKTDSQSEDANFYYGFGFSDQQYLIRTADFKNRIYGERHEASERYPVYGGALFEKRVDSWMRNHNFLRLTSKQGSFAHKNFHHVRWLNRLLLWCGYYNR
jgi:hypothetical protein